MQMETLEQRINKLVSRLSQSKRGPTMKGNSRTVAQAKAVSTLLGQGYHFVRSSANGDAVYAKAGSEKTVTAGGEIR
jgi:hypothetical protein